MQSTPSVAPSEQAALPVSGAPTYATRWIEGTLFTIGTTPKHQVSVGWITETWQGTVGGLEPHLFVILVNRGEAPVTFDPDTIRVWARADRGDEPLRTYTVAECESEIRNKATMRQSKGSRVNGTPPFERPPSPVFSPSVGGRWPGKVAQGLMKMHTLEPGATYKGVVYLKKTRASALRVEVKVGDDVFLVELPRAKTE
jgi:hypothetical protein